MYPTDAGATNTPTTLDRTATQELGADPDVGRPLVTFALLAYNQGSFVGEAVASALAQTYSPIQFIFSDDASSDDTFNIIRTIASGYAGPNQLVLNRNDRNLGVGMHVNRVMELAKGDLVVAAAGDDVSLDSRVQALVAAWLARGKPPAICSQAACIDNTGKLTSPHFTGYEGTYPVDGESRLSCITRFVTRGHCNLLGCTEAWSRSLFDEFGPFRCPLWHEDNALAFRAWLLGRVEYVDASLVLYRQHADNICFSDTRNTAHSVSELARREERLSEASARRMLHLDQHLLDVAVARQHGLLGEGELTAIETGLRKTREIESQRATWWAIGNSERLKRLPKVFGYGKDNWWWFLGRILPRPAWVRCRAALGVISRALRTTDLRERKLNDQVRPNT